MQIINNSPSFCGYKSEFSRKLEQYISSGIKNELKEQELTDSFSKVLVENMTESNEKGKGVHGVVYGIDDDYVFKVGRFSFPALGKLKLAADKINENLKTYYGGVLARIGDVEIMRNAFKTKDALPAGLPRKVMSDAEKKSYYVDVYLKRFSGLPQEAYDKIAADFKTLNYAGKEFDTINPNNFTADGDEIKIVDEIIDTGSYGNNNLAKLCRVFINSYDDETAAVYDVAAAGGRKNIFKKLILASEKSELPFAKGYDDRNELNSAMQLCGYNEPFGEIERTLRDYRNRYFDMDERLQKVSQFLKELDEPDMITTMFYD